MSNLKIQLLLLNSIQFDDRFRLTPRYFCYDYVSFNFVLLENIFLSNSIQILCLTEREKKAIFFSLSLVVELLNQGN